ncbi:hypothetical protein [Sandaracinus amylolyticus]|uniref:hypothetical protein n=1 Tax=Sandaracinus amylolyticus TaxID=927083 RepID=UPI001F28BF1D|nr:hypothetical protein [Sandaracinus amylolyticus]
MSDHELRGLIQALTIKLDTTATQVRDIDQKLDDLRVKQIPELRAEIGALKVKSGLWGAAAGFVPVVLLIVVQLLRS